MKAETRSDYQAAVLGAVERVIAALDEALDLEGLARGAALSTFHFHRVFRGVVGETPLELHRRLRLERAVESLCRTSRTVTEIAFDAGYETHEDFTRSFRHQYGVAPSAFRRRSRAALAGDVEALGRMLADDAVFHQDGGGKRRAALKPICGKDKIVRFFEGGLRHRAAKRGDGGFDQIERAQINGLPGFVIHTHDGLETVALEIADDRIVAIYAIRNPDKLRHLS